MERTSNFGCAVYKNQQKRDHSTVWLYTGLPVPGSTWPGGTIAGPPVPGSTGGSIDICLLPRQKSAWPWHSSAVDAV